VPKIKNVKWCHLIWPTLYIMSPINSGYLQHPNDRHLMANCGRMASIAKWLLWEHIGNYFKIRQPPSLFPIVRSLTHYDLPVPFPQNVGPKSTPGDPWSSIEWPYLPNGASDPLRVTFALCWLLPPVRSMVKIYSSIACFRCDSTAFLLHAGLESLEALRIFSRPY